MKKLKVTKLNIAPQVPARLSELGLSHGDLDFILCFGRRLLSQDTTFYVFDPALAPENSELSARLAGVALTVSGDRIIDVRRDFDMLSAAAESKPLSTL